jgi:LPS-assembly protein
MRSSIIVFFLSFSVLFAEETPVIKALYQETLEDRHIARGDVSVKIGDTKIYSDELEYNFKSKTLIAKGNVIIDIPGQSITAKEVFLNIDEKTGEMKDVFILNEQGLFIKAEYVKKESENVYRLKNSSLTSCTQPNPRWSINSKNIKFKKDDYVDIWGANFKIKSIPFLYLPYFRYPLPKEGRKTGFLMPQLGYSELKGYVISEAFFWAISRSTDLTIQGDYFSQWGEGLSAEFRWRTFRGFGNAIFYNFFYKEGKRDYHLNLNLREELPQKFLLTAEVNRQSTFNFYSQFMNDFNRISQSFSSSSLNISRTFSLYSFHLRVDRNESHLSGVSSVTSRTPQIKFSRLNSRFLSLPLFFSFDSSLENFSQKDSKSSISFPSFYFTPSFSLNLSPFPWLSVSNDTTYKFDYYGKSFDIEKNEYSDKSISRNFLISRFAIVGPSFYRIFQSKDLKIKHVIEPRIVYSISTKYKESSLSSPFERRAPLPTNELFFGISNRLLKKSGKQSPTELLSFELSQSFYFDPSSEIKYSDINGILRLVLTPASFAELRTSYDMKRKGMKSSLFSLNYLTSGGNIFRVSWSRDRIVKEDSLKTISNQARFFTSIKIPYIPVDFAGDTSYDFYSKKMLNYSFRLGYNYQCINFSIEYRYLIRLDGKKDNDFRFNVSFANIGIVQDIFGGRGF